jgi:hypothetical protein
MGLQLYRRHSKACKAQRPEDSRTGKFEEDISLATAFR